MKDFPPGNVIVVMAMSIIMINFTILQASFLHKVTIYIQSQEKHFRKVQFTYVSRGSNNAAHCLTQYTRNILDFVIRIKETLCIIECVLVQDILFLFSS